MRAQTTGPREPVARRLPGSGGIGLEAHVHPGGEEAPLVLLHGLASNLRLWDGVAERLATLGHPVLALDQRGHGGSDKPDEGYDMATACADLSSALDALGWVRPVLVGQSWGGNVVLELAARRPDVTRGVALVDGGWIDLRRRFPTWEACVEALAPPATSGTPRTAIEAAVRAAHPDWPEAGVAGVLACFEERPDGTVAPWLTLERHLLLLRALWEHDPPSRYPEVAAPVLLVAADAGAGTDPHKRDEVTEAARSLRASRTVWMPGDHDLHAQHPGPLADLLHAECTEGMWADVR